MITSVFLNCTKRRLSGLVRFGASYPRLVFEGSSNERHKSDSVASQSKSTEATVNEETKARIETAKTGIVVE